MVITRSQNDLPTRKIQSCLVIKKKKTKEMMVKTKTEQTKSHPSYHHLTIVPLHLMQLVSIWDFSPVQ